jgi:hypothetical protein
MQVWRVLAKQVGKCWRVWRVLAEPLDECPGKQDRSFYAQITYFICIKWSSLHSHRTRVKLAKLAFRKSGESLQNGLANVGESGEFEQNRLANFGQSGESEQTRLANIGDSGESGTFPKKAILASTRICQKW